MNSKPWYRQKKFWALGVIMMLVVGVGGLYLWQLVPSSSYRELQRAVEEEREERQARGDRTVYRDGLEPAEKSIGHHEEPVVSPEELNAWCHQLGKFDHLVHYLNPIQSNGSSPVLDRILPDFVRISALNRQYVLQSSSEFSLEKLDQWRDQYLTGRNFSEHEVSSTIAWCIVRAEWNGDEKIALKLLDRFLAETLESDYFYGIYYSRPYASDCHLARLMIVLHYCGIDNSTIWERIGEALLEAELKQNQTLKKLDTRLYYETESLVNHLKRSSPPPIESPIKYFMDGAVISGAESIYKPIYTQRVRSFAGNIYKEDFERALRDIEIINNLTKRMYWNRNPAITDYLTFDLELLGSREDKLAWLKFYHAYKRSPMTITPLEYTTNVYTYIRHGVLADGMEVHGSKPFTPITGTFYHSTERDELVQNLSFRLFSLEDIPEGVKYDAIRERYRENLSERMTPGVTLVQTRDTSLADPVVFDELYYRISSDESFANALTSNDPITVYFAELTIFPDLETIRAKLAPGVTTSEHLEDQ